MTVRLGGQIQFVLALRALLLAVDRLTGHMRATRQNVQVVAVLAAFPQTILHVFVGRIRGEVVVGHFKVLEGRELTVSWESTTNCNERE